MMTRFFMLCLLSAPLLAATSEPSSPTKADKHAKDIEVIVESDHLCDPKEETRMPTYY